MSHCINELKECNIGLDGEEFYAVMAAYVNKINEFMGKEKTDAMELLRLATQCEYLKDGQSQQAFDAALKEFLKDQDKAICDICESDKSEEEKVEALHALAVSEGQKQKGDIQMSFFSLRLRSKKISNAYDGLDRDKSIYNDNLDQYRQLCALRYTPKALELFIQKTAGNVKTDMATIKSSVLANIAKEENKFLAYQNKFIGRAVSLSVEDSCQILYANEETQESC